MSTITTKDGTQIYYKDWGTGPVVTFSHGWPLNADMWDGQMLFLAQNGFRVSLAANGTGMWRITGQKTFITWGEHDLADNIVHLVLARAPGAPAGTRGISLFLVPKVLPDGRRNSLRCLGLEDKQA